MDITRNWRLKTSRNQLLATRDPQTGEVMLPQQTPSRVAVDVYTFEDATPAPKSEAELAQAAR